MLVAERRVARKEVHERQVHADRFGRAARGRQEESHDHGPRSTGCRHRQGLDYLACPYPEGFLGEDFAYLFNHEQIERVFFIGFQDGEELAFNERLASAESRPPAASDG